MKIYYTYEKDSLSGDEKIRQALICCLGKSAKPDEIRILRDGYGKPRAESPRNVRFSVTHTGRWWICVVGEEKNGPLGIDAELRSRRVKNPVSMAERFFSPPEAAFIRKEAAEKTQREAAVSFLRIWVRKEAYLKYTGRGLGGGMSGFTVTACLPCGGCPERQDGILEDPEAEYVSLNLSEDLIAVICRRKHTGDEEMELCGMK